MDVKIRIDGDNEAFFHEDETVNDGEFARILRSIACAMDSGEYSYSAHTEDIRDINGNVCGHISINF